MCIRDRHRAHSSTEGVAHHVDEAVAGFLMEKEITFLNGTLEHPEKPFVAVDVYKRQELR